MKKLGFIALVGTLTLFLVIIACTDKEINLITNVELEFDQNIGSREGFVNDELPSTMIITPEAFLPEFEYFFSYEVLEGQGVFLNSDATELPPNENIQLTKTEEETNFTLSLNYKGLAAGNHRVKVTASDNFDKKIETVLSYTIENIPVLWTATTPTEDLLLGDTVLATVELQNNTGAAITFENSYNFTNGSGELRDENNNSIQLGQANSITPGVYQITIEPTQLGTNTINFNLEDSNGQQLVASIILNVVTEIIDTTPPLITLNGNNPLQLTLGAAYQEPGATAMDNVDGSFDVPDSGISGTVDTNTEGSYSITYTVSDAAGNAAEEVIRTVVVSSQPDTTPPVITLKGDNPLELTIGSTYQEPGATAMDNIDETFDVPDSGISGTVDTNTEGSYSITYTVSDLAGNAAEEVIRIVVVSSQPDTTPPVISLKGDNPLELTIGSTYQEPGATAMDNVDGTFDVPDSGISGTVDTNTAGNYSITYNVSDTAGNPAIEVTRTVVVSTAPDTTPPVITLKGDNPLELTVGDTYQELGATAMDNVDGTFDVPDSGISGTVDTNTAGNYSITYNVSDTAGNPAIEVTRTVVVSTAPDTTPPVITLKGDNPLELTVGDTYQEPGATAMDNVDGTFDVPGSGISGTVDTNTAGNYSITYNISDTAGNPAEEVTRVINVISQNRAPIADASQSSPTSGPIPLIVNFTSGGSSDDKGITSYNWDFMDSGNENNNSSPTYTFNTPGTYMVELTVEDAEGLSNSTTITITATDPPMPYKGHRLRLAGQNLTEVANFCNVVPTTARKKINIRIPDKLVEGTIHRITIDSRTSYYYVDTSSDDPQSDADENIESTAVMEEVDPCQLRPTAVIQTSPSTMDGAPDTVNFTAANSTTPSGSTITSYSWNFGDPSSGANNTFTSTSPTASHEYQTANTYTVELIVENSFGVTDTATTTTRITSPLPCAGEPPCQPGEVRRLSDCQCVNDNPGNGCIFLCNGQSVFFCPPECEPCEEICP